MKELIKKIDQEIKKKEIILKEYSILFDKIEEYFKYYPETEIYYRNSIFKLKNKKLIRYCTETEEETYFYQTSITNRIDMIEILKNELSSKLGD